MILSISHLSYYNKLRHLNLPSLQHCRRRGDLVQILKVSYHYDIDDHLFTPSKSTATKGHTYSITYCTNSYTISIFIVSRVINDWYSLPQSIVDSSVNDFKSTNVTVIAYLILYSNWYS